MVRGYNKVSIFDIHTHVYIPLVSYVFFRASFLLKHQVNNVNIICESKINLAEYMI